ncbi:MAG TPA: choice-of-anchor P family protein [Candidatus Baltobacteraceae bacterium]|nr:choice-of-anchor P family protein [Candidatus Baltobacteraceae bacterium]
MKKFLAAVLLSTVVFTSCGGHNASPMVPGVNQQQALPGASGADTSVPRGSDAVPSGQNPGPYTHGETYAVQLYTNGQVGNRPLVDKGGRHPLTAVATPTPCPPLMTGVPPACAPMPCPPGFTGVEPTCIPMNICPPSCGPTPTPVPTATPTPAPTLPPTAGTPIDDQQSADCMMAAQTAVQTNANVSSQYVTTGAGYGRLLRTNSKSSNGLTSTSYVPNVNILSGLVTADSVTTTAGVTLQAPTSQTAFRNLRIGGQPVVATGAVNQQVAIPNVGYVVLNEQTVNILPIGFGFGASVQTAGIHVYVTATTYPYGLPQGYDIVVGSGIADIAIPSNGAYATAQSYGAMALNGSPVSEVAFNCPQGQDQTTQYSFTFGSNGLVQNMTNVAETVQFGPGGPTFRSKQLTSLGALRSLSAAPSVVNGSIWNRNISAPSGGTAGAALASISSLVLGSDISANGLQAEAVALDVPGMQNGIGTIVSVGANSLTIGGKTYSGPLPTNLRVTIPGLGTAIVGQTISSGSAKAPYIADVVALHLTVTNANNSHGLPRGDYYFGRAHADVTLMPLPNFGS